METSKIMEIIAKEKDMTPQEVENEIRLAIREAMASKDPQAQMLWKEVAPDGKEPSIEHFLDYCVDRLKKMEEKYRK